MLLWVIGLLELELEWNTFLSGVLVSFVGAVNMSKSLTSMDYRYQLYFIEDKLKKGSEIVSRMDEYECADYQFIQQHPSKLHHYSNSVPFRLPSS